MKEKYTKKPRPAKHLKVTHKHRKSYRKRHYIALIVFITLAITLINSVVLYFNNSYVAQRLASQTISDTFGKVLPKSEQTIRSNYGFTLSFDQKQYYPSAIDSNTGDLYVGNELSVARSYDTIRLSKQSVKAEDTDSVKLAYYPTDKPTSADLATLEDTYVTQKQNDPTRLIKTRSTEQAYGNVTFKRTEWTREVGTDQVRLITNFVTYTGIANGSPLTVIVYQGIGKVSGDEVMKGLSFSDRTQAAVNAPTANSAVNRGVSLDLMDNLLGISSVTAASPTYAASERVSAAYSAAVVKVYNVQVGDLAIDGRTIITKHIAGGTGSGFIVSKDGYIATNGHVAVISPRDEIVTYAFQAAQQGNEAPIATLIGLSGLTKAELSLASSETEAVKIIVKKIYTIPESRFSFINSKQNLLVGLADEQVDIKELLTKTAAKQSYPSDKTIKEATLKKADYDGTILPAVTNEFTKSDVALIKIEGANYPMTQLGAMDGLAQGGNLNIMGFPGVGSNNGIVSNTKTSATLTTGKVSSKKSDTGGHNLIETDTEIGHGNSGGPAFNDAGEVVGIATYAVDPGGSGDGALNYVRDIKDFQTIARDSSVDYTTSETQTEWNKAIDQFYNARYKKALVSFANVKELYPDHPRLTELTATADKRIANGENIDDFPVLIVVIATITIVIGLIESVMVIVIHKKKHRALVQAVDNSQAQVPVPGMQPQYVQPLMASSQVFAQQQATSPQQVVESVQATPFTGVSTEPYVQPQDQSVSYPETPPVVSAESQTISVKQEPPLPPASA